MRPRKNECIIRLGRQKERDRYKDQYVDGQIIFKMELRDI
jgi:hypothetical protein